MRISDWSSDVCSSDLSFHAEHARFAIEICDGSELSGELVIAADDIFLVGDIAGEYRGAEATTGDTPPVQAKVDPGIGRRGGSRYAERRRGIPVEAVHRIESDQALIVNICQRCDVAPAFRHRQCYARRDVELMLG